MFRRWGNLEASIRSNHAAFISLANNMQLLFLNSRFGLACFGQGKRRAARHPLPFFPKHIAASFLGLRTKSRLLLSLRHVTCFPIICIARSLPGNRRARSSFYRGSSSISGGITTCFPLDLFLFIVAFQLPGRGPKWTFLHNVEFSDPAGFRSLSVTRKQTLYNHFSLFIGLGVYLLYYFLCGCTDQVTAISAPARL